MDVRAIPLSGTHPPWVRVKHFHLQRGHTASAPSVTARPGRLAQEPSPATGESEHVMWGQRKEMDTRSGTEPVLWASSTR